MVIVEVDPTQAKKLAVAQQVGALVLVSHEVSLSDESKKRPVELFQRGPYRKGEMPVIPYGDYTEPPGGGILH
jgi:Flp pilus assembly protein CpaB